MPSAKQKEQNPYNLTKISTRSVARVIVLDRITNEMEGDLPAIRETIDELQGSEGEALVQILFNQYFGIKEGAEADERVLDACPECIRVEDLQEQLIFLLQVVCACEDC
jgi:hypothetical protein